MGGFKAFLAGVAIVSAGVSSMCRADSVSFYTTITFTSAPTSSIPSLVWSGVGTNTLTSVSGGKTDTLTAIAVTYNNSHSAGTDPEVTLNAPIPPDPTPVSYGHFAFTGNAFRSFIGASIKIDVFQTATEVGGVTTPTPSLGATGNFVGSADATFLSSGLNGDNVALSFTTPSTLSFKLPTGAPAFPPAVVYRIDGSQVVFKGGFTTQTVISGDVVEPLSVGGGNVAPLPQTATLGLGMFASLGLVFGLKRKFNSELAA